MRQSNRGVDRPKFLQVLPLRFGDFRTGIALVAFADTSVLSRIYAQRGGYTVDSNKELMSLGFVNLATGLFQGFSVSASASRTPVAEQAGSKTQVTGLVGVLLVTLLLYFAPTLLKSIPPSE